MCRASQHLKTHLQCQTQITARQKTAIKHLLHLATHNLCSSRIHNAFIIFKQPRCHKYLLARLFPHRSVWSQEQKANGPNVFYSDYWQTWFLFKIIIVIFHRNVKNPRSMWESIKSECSQKDYCQKSRYLIDFMSLESKLCQSFLVGSLKIHCEINDCKNMLWRGLFRKGSTGSAQGPL